jgi:hypothetical protein
MNKTLSTLLLACVGCLAISQSLWGQSTSAAGGIRGYLNPRTGAFHPTPLVADTDADAQPAATVFGGKFVVNFTITVASAIPTTDPISCAVSLAFEDNLAAGGHIIEEEVVVTGTRSGSTVTCKATLPYSWTLVTPTTDMVPLSYTISSAGATSPFRLSSQSIATIKVPANGATTTETVTATI